MRVGSTLKTPNAKAKIRWFYYPDNISRCKLIPGVNGLLRVYCKFECECGSLSVEMTATATENTLNNTQ